MSEAPNTICTRKACDKQEESRFWELTSFNHVESGMKKDCISGPSREPMYHYLRNKCGNHSGSRCPNHCKYYWFLADTNHLENWTSWGSGLHSIAMQCSRTTSPPSWLRVGVFRCPSHYTPTKFGIRSLKVRCNFNRHSASNNASFKLLKWRCMRLRLRSPRGLFVSL